MTGVTVLRVARGYLATKRWIMVQAKPHAVAYNAGTWFSASRVEVGDIHQLSALLTDLECDPKALIIRGEPLPEVDLRRVRRLKHRKKAGTDNEIGPFFREPAGGLPWAMIDFDKIEVPQHIDPVNDPGGAVEHLVGLLPDCFRAVTYHWQLSSSAGMGGPGVLSAHVWFWLDRNVMEAELTAWAETLDVRIDASLFRPVQPHYTAAPLFEGVRDPLQRRSGLRIGLTDAVTLPVINPTRRIQAGAPGKRISGLSGGFDAHLARLGDGPGLRGFNDPLLRAVASYVFEHSEHIDAEALKGELRQRIDAAPKGPHRSQGDLERYASDEYLDQLIDTAVEKLPEWRAEHEAQQAEATPPHWPGAPLPLAEAVELLDKTVAAFFNKVDAGETPRVGIRATAALGKTQAVIRTLAERPGVRDMNVEVYAPDHKLTSEWADRLRPDAPHLHVQVIRGRSSPAPHGNGEPLCARPEAAKDVARANMSVYDTLCEVTLTDTDGVRRVERCPHFATCSASGYLAQFAHQGPAVRIMPHAYLALPRGERLPKPDLVIVDERFWPEAVYQRNFGLDRLTASRPARLREKVGQRELEIALRLLAVNQVIREALVADRPLLAALRESGQSRETLDELQRAIHDNLDGPTLLPSASDAEIRSKIAGAERGQMFAHAALLSILRDEIDTGRDNAHGVELRCDVPQTNGERQDRVFIHRRRRLPRLANTAVLLLDADLNREIVEPLVPNLEVVEAAVERNAEVIQVRDTRCSKRRLVGLKDDRESAARHLAEIYDLIRAEAAGGRKVLVVTYKPVRLLMTGEDDKKRLPPGAPLKDAILDVEIAHFGAIRGQDRWKQCDTVIIAGRHQMPVPEYEALGRALYYDRVAPLTFQRPDEHGNLTLPTDRRGYRLRGGRQADAAVDVHPDPDIQALIELHREAESAQAIDRLRLVHNDKPKRVVVLSNVPFDLTVDRLVRWNDVVPSRLKLLALTAPAIPLSARELARCFPETWSSLAAVRSWLQREGLMGIEPLKEYLLGFRYPLTQVEYRRTGVRGKAAQALVSGPADRLQETLEAVVGPVSCFKARPRPFDMTTERPSGEAEMPAPPVDHDHDLERAQHPFPVAEPVSLPDFSLTASAAHDL